MAGGRPGICWMAGPPSPEKSGWKFSCERGRRGWGEKGVGV
jgi:hypothetical protein